MGTVKTFKNKLLHLHFALVYVIFRTGFFRLIDELDTRHLPFLRE